MMNVNEKRADLIAAMKSYIKEAETELLYDFEQEVKTLSSISTKLHTLLVDIEPLPQHFRRYHQICNHVAGEKQCFLITRNETTRTETAVMMTAEDGRRWHALEQADPQAIEKVQAFFDEYATQGKTLKDYLDILDLMRGASTEARWAVLRKYGLKPDVQL